jgi:hypothetical protein
VFLRFTSGKELQLLNYCRIFLHVELLSDVILLDGSRFKSSCWDGQPSPSCIDS